MNRNEPYVDLAPGDFLLGDHSADGLARAGRVDELRAHRTSLHREAARMIDAARVANRELTTEEEARYDEITSRMAGINSRLDRASDNRRMIGRDSARYHEPADIGASSAAWRAMEEGRTATADMPLDALTRYGMERSRGNSVEIRDLLTTNVDTVPRIVYEEIIMRLVESSAVLTAGPRTITTDDTGAPLRIARLTEYGTAGIVGEGSAIPESDSTYGYVDLTPSKYALITQASFELLSDTTFDLASYLAQDLGTKLGTALSAHLCTGSGTAQPEGIITNATVGVQGTATSPTIPDIMNLWASLPVPARGNATWIMNPSVWAGIIAANDTTGRSLVLGDLATPSAQSLMGRPVLLDSNMPAAGTAIRSVFVGDVSRYYTVRYAGPLRLESSDAYAFANDLMTWRAILRVDGKVVDTNSARVFRGVAAS